MSFASVIFFLFLPIVFALHWLVPARKWQNSVLLGASYVFYGWWDWTFCLLMLASSLVDYIAGLWIDRETEQRQRKTILVGALSLNLLTLGYFKYCNFFADSFVAAFRAVGVDLPLWTGQIALPVGISFYTFQTMSYTLDIYFGRFRPMASVVDYLSFVSFFPQLVAGPIERATNLLPQFNARRVFSPESASEGCRFIIWGLAKKMLVADNLAEIVNSSYGFADRASGAQLFLGTICFAFQIYCDFSAYSDMAVGTARLFGIRLMRNFAYPYFSQSITEFWRRWHISLSTWFRDYVYIPLGGNRVSRAKHYRNLLLVALISGLWHGAGWTFVVWGALHGCFLVADRIFGWGERKIDACSTEDIPGGESLLPDLVTVLRMFRTFSLACVAWIFFRAENVAEAFTILGKIVAGLTEPGFYRGLWYLVGESSSPLAALGVLVLVEWWNRKSWNTLSIGQQPVFLRWAAYSFICWYILLFGMPQTEPFIYFRF